jgi:hypothetical protein
LPLLYLIFGDAKELRRELLGIEQLLLRCSMITGPENTSTGWLFG